MSRELRCIATLDDQAEVCDALHKHALYVRLGAAEPVRCKWLIISGEESRVTVCVDLCGVVESFDLTADDRLVVGRLAEGI